MPRMATRRSSRVAKSNQPAKSPPKSAKSSKSAKGPKATKGTKTAKSNKSSKSTKSAKSAKSAKSTKSTKSAKSAKSTKSARSAKSSTPSKAVKQPAKRKAPRARTAPKKVKLEVKLEETSTADSCPPSNEAASASSEQSVEEPHESKVTDAPEDLPGNVLSPTPTLADIAVKLEPVDVLDMGCESNSDSSVEEAALPTVSDPVAGSAEAAPAPSSTAAATLAVSAARPAPPAPAAAPAPVPAPVLTQAQAEVLHAVLTQRKNVFFTGAAGTGKSFVLRQIVEGVR